MKARSTSNWQFYEDGNDFHFKMELVDKINSYYFPLCNERYRASITPLLAGDSALDINSFLLKPITEEELYSSTYSRNFWVKFDDIIWSATGNSLRQKMQRDEKVIVKGGFLCHQIERTNKNFGIKSTILNFVPSTNDAVELMRVDIENIGNEPKSIQCIVAIPVYARSADNIRDHHHVTSLLNRVKKTENGIIVHPTLSFDERGHVKNHLNYQIFAVDEKGRMPIDINPVLEDFIGNGTLDWPDYVVEDRDKEHCEMDIHGRHTIAAMKFEKVELAQGEKISYYTLMGIDNVNINSADFLNAEKFNSLLTETKLYWKNKISSIKFESGSQFFDNWLKWVSLQPILRRIYGNSFLPHHDYGRGGRGWRDLWQDILSLILIENKEVRNLLISNFAGVRLDGSNATIIGSNPGEFKFDRNNIPRVWMDHGAWPLYTTYFYIQQTGDLDILLEEQSYFNDQFTHRCQQTNPNYVESFGTRLKTTDNRVHFGTIFEHLLIQNLTSCFNVGINNNILLEGGDWNDALDMASDFGESVAFTSFYASNLKVLADLITALKLKSGQNKIKITEELVNLVDPEIDMDDPNAKRKLLINYFDIVADGISGEFKDVSIDELSDYLNNIADHIIDHLNSEEIVSTENGYSWYNGYYDNFGDRVEGQYDQGIRMTLTGQVFPLVTKIADDGQIDKVIKSVNHFLVDEDIGGPRLNTNFHEIKTSLGRAFGFAYGHKENGAMFSHMVIIYAYGLYSNSRAKDGYQIITSLFNHLQNTDKSQIYPNLPEYINQQGKGMYSYLTGSASWLIYLMVTQVYGVRGELGDLIIEPKLVKDQFKEGQAKICLVFRNIDLQITYHNQSDKEYGDYEITSYQINDDKEEKNPDPTKLKLTFDDLLSISNDDNLKLDIYLK